MRNSGTASARSRGGKVRPCERPAATRTTGRGGRVLYRRAEARSGVFGGAFQSRHCPGGARPHGGGAISRDASHRGRHERGRRGQHSWGCARRSGPLARGESGVCPGTGASTGPCGGPSRPRARGWAGCDRSRTVAYSWYILAHRRPRITRDGAAPKRVRFCSWPDQACGRVTCPSCGKIKRCLELDVVVLVDTSVWIEIFRKPSKVRLEDWLDFDDI